MDAVKHFQRRHGLDDGWSPRPRTIKQLNVPLQDRVLQIQLTLERWRWLPTEFSAPPIIVNIPDFRLRALDENNKVAMDMRVVVGKAMRTQTPVFTRDMTYVVLRPYWNVPPSILRSEIIPAIQRDRGYIARKNYEVDHGMTGRWSRQERFPMTCWRNCGQETSRYGRSPDRTNALGLVKLIFPERAQRLSAQHAFSGCCSRAPGVISAMAAFASKSPPNWPRGFCATIRTGRWSGCSKECRAETTM